MDTETIIRGAFEVLKWLAIIAAIGRVLEAVVEIGRRDSAALRDRLRRVIAAVSEEARAWRNFLKL
jgi:hypothetical protein